MRVYNFGAGPATLPAEILIQAQAEFLEWQDLGMSVVEVSHRSSSFMALLDETIELLRELLQIPLSHDILLMGTPTRFHFGSIPLNFLKQQADYIVSGAWSKMAAEDAKKVGSINIAGSNEVDNYLLSPLNFNFNDNADYCYFTPNETLSGLKISTLPNRPKNVPLIADMTSCLLSESINIKDYAMIIAGVQKNLAPSGMSVVIVEKEFLSKNKLNSLPAFFDYRVHSKNSSNYATPPSFNIYMANLMLKWLKNQGGISQIEKINSAKSKLLYQTIDDSSFYDCPILKSQRSKVNVTFRLKDESLNQNFLEQAKKQGLVALKGHRSVGGMRASIYNAMPLEGVNKLNLFMKEFAKNIGEQA